MVVVLDVFVVCVVVVTGGVFVVVDLTVVVVVVTGATCVTDEVGVAAGAAVATGAVAVVVDVLDWTAGFLRWAFLWCTRLRGAAAADDVAIDVELDVVDVLEVLDVDAPPELPQPATTTLPAITASSAAFIQPAPLVAHGLVSKANNG